MKHIHNIRYGFATNSSSTHSIVLLNNDTETLDDFDGCEEFGWNFFTLASEDAKRIYLAQCLKNNFVKFYKLTKKDASILAANWSGLEEIDPEGYVDHQSLITFPYINNDWEPQSISMEFYNEFLKFILQPEIVILGGDDNSETEHPLLHSKRVHVLNSEEKIGFNVLKTSSKIHCRYDSKGKFWSLFNIEDGTKVRMSFCNDANAEKSEFPELVDVKITNYCNKNCHFCYQGSTTNGIHAHLSDIENVICTLSYIETFEIAIGGGEPTTHPEFISIIDYAYSLGIKPNFSTRNIDWLCNNWDKINGKVGAVGVSIDSEDKLVDILSKLQLLKGLKCTLQVIVGSCNKSSLQNIFEISKIFDRQVLLLGWKNTNRGKKGPDYTFDLGKVLEKFFNKDGNWVGPNLSFDTMLVTEYKKWLEENSAPWYFTIKEGAHSMYIDCVTNKMAKSSYVSKEEMVSINDKFNLVEEIKEFFSNL